MHSTVTAGIAVLAVACGAAFCGTAAHAAGSDTFNRGALGPTWVVTSGSLSISNHQMVGTTSSLGYLKASSKDTAASATIFLGSTDLEYGAIALGNIGGGSNAFVKIQQQNGAGFDHAGFYNGNNSGSDFFALSSPVPSPAVLDVFFCGTVATMRITSSAGVQTYSHDYGTVYGPGGGLGTYGSVHLDNYVGFKGSCAALARAIPALAMPHEVDKSLIK